MNEEKKKPWKNAPLNLSEKAIENPFLVIENFFGEVRLPVLRKRLHEFLLAGIEDQHKWEHEKVVELIYTFDHLEMLMEALWLLHQAGTTCTEEESSIRVQNKYDVVWSSDILSFIAMFDYDESEFYTNKLNRHEEMNPYLVINELFEWNDLDGVKSKLSFWCHTAFTNPWEYSAMDKEEMAGLYKKIDKVVEAAFVINELQLLKKEKLSK